MSRLLGIGNAVMLVLFVSWAGFQYNDPDALIWILIYSFAALGCILFFGKSLPRSAAWAYVLLCVAGALYLLVRVVTTREFVFDEQGREMMGLLICAGWIAVLARKSVSRSQRAA